MAAVLLLLAVLFLALSGTPLFVIMALGALVGFTFISQVDIAVIAQELYRLASTPVLIAIPLFTLAGYILAESRAPERALKIINAIFGWMPGGVALITLITTSVFTALTGASGITIIALGGLLLPILLKAGYPEKFAIGLITCTGSLGLLFPPSLPIILYGIISKTSVNELFIAGILPGILIIIILFAFSFIVSIKWKAISPTKPSLKEIVKAFGEAIFEFPLPIFIIWGIYTGKFTAAESAAITAVWVIIVEVFIYRDIKLKDFPRIVKESMILVGAIFAILGMAMGFTNFLIDQQIPQKLFEIVREFIKSPITFFVVLNIFLLIVGMLMDIFSAIVVIVPLIYPIAVGYGIDPIHLGIVFLTNLEIGYLTPPVGINLFISSFRFGKPVTYLYKVAIPFILMLLTALLIITYVPDISLRLVRGVVAGQVVSEDGAPVKAKIRVIGVKREFHTDEDGSFKIYVPLPERKKEAQVFLLFEADGFKPYPAKVTVQRAKTVKLNVRMQKVETNTMGF